MQDVPALSPPRIAFITGGLKLGGTTTFLCNLAGEFIRRGLAVEVFSFEQENPLATDFQRLKIPIHLCDERRSIFEDRVGEILQRLATFRPTITVANLGPASFEVLRYVPPDTLRVGMGQSDDGIVYDTIRVYTPHMDCVVVVSQTMKEKALALRELTQLPVYYLPYGVPMPQNDATLRPAGEALEILYLGRLDRVQKRVHLFPAILEQLKTSGISFHWTIVGEGPERANLEKVMKGNPPSQTVTFFGKASYRDVPEILATHDVLLLPSDYEGLPLSLLEAMGHGLVPVISDLPSGVRDLVDASTGILVPVKDLTGYARAIIHLHGHRAELTAKSLAARTRVQRNFSIAAMADRWLATLPQKSGTANWPDQWEIAGPLTAGNSVRFSKPARWVRRLVRKIQDLGTRPPPL